MYSNVDVLYQEPNFSVELVPLSKPTDESVVSCWCSPFKHALIANTHPTVRSAGEGLELSFELMNTRAGIVQGTKIKNSILLQGFSTILIPVKKFHNGIQ